MSTPKAVKVTVTSHQVGSWTTAPYSHAAGLQVNAIYVVPIYRVTVGAGVSFKAIRFGLVNRGQNPPPQERICDAGLAEAQHASPSWISTYSPHSFQGAARPGAWQIYPGKSFLIHEGTENTTSMIGGSLGCIEIVGPGEWNRFLATLESMAGSTCAEIGHAKSMSLTIEAATRPVAKLRV